MSWLPSKGETNINWWLAATIAVIALMIVAGYAGLLPGWNVW